MCSLYQMWYLELIFDCYILFDNVIFEHNTSMFRINSHPLRYLRSGLIDWVQSLEQNVLCAGYVQTWFGFVSNSINFF